MAKPLGLFGACVLWMAGVAVSAQPFAFSAGVAAPADDSAALAKAVQELARQVIPVQHDPDRRRELDDRFRLQLAAGRYAEAGTSLAALRALPAPTPQTDATNLLYEVYARARQDSGPFDEVFPRAFRDALGRQDDRTAALVLRALGLDPTAPRRDLDQALAAAKKGSLSLDEALALVRAYQVEEVFRSVLPLAPPLIAEDDSRRYAIDRDVQVRTPEGATVCALVVRPRSAAGPLPALLNFTIYADPGTMMDEARRTASHGYAGVEGMTRGKGCSPDAPVPYEHDGADAAALIDWIARQPWSDGRVGMYGGSYEGFTQWAAAKHRPKALKALMPSVAVAPGIDVPMEGNVFQSFVYYWPFYTTTNKTLDNGPYNDRARWWRMNREWYAKGAAYRSLPAIEGTPNPFFVRWLGHPSYDAYWQAMIPYRQEFAGIDVPVLTTTGYYDDAQLGAVYYLREHYRYRPGAEHYLLIGPYDHVRGQRGTFSRLGNPQTVLRGYETDPVAQLDLGELRYQWFDHVFRGAPRPALLQDRVNYEVMGANEWKHAPSIAAMGPRRLRLHLTAEPAGERRYRLKAERPGGRASVPLTVDLVDRGDVDRMVPGGGIVDREIDLWTGLAFVSDPLPQSIEVSGLVSGRLDFAANKKDFDFGVDLYELTPQGEYVALSSYLTRASHARDRTHRRLLTPGRRERLDFRSGRLTSRRLQAGSRIVAVLGVVKSPGAQIDYGTGRDVSDETLADAGAPLTIRWFAGSYLDLPTADPGHPPAK